MSSEELARLLTDYWPALLLLIPIGGAVWWVMEKIYRREIDSLKATITSKDATIQGLQTTINLAKDERDVAVREGEKTKASLDTIKKILAERPTVIDTAPRNRLADLVDQAWVSANAVNQANTAVGTTLDTGLVEWWNKPLIVEPGLGSIGKQGVYLSEEDLKKIAHTLPRKDDPERKS